MKKKSLWLLVAICVSIALLLQSGQSGGVKNLSVFGSSYLYDSDKTFADSALNSSMSTGTFLLAFAVAMVVARVACPTAAEVQAETQDVFVTEAELAVAEAAATTVAVYNDNFKVNNIVMQNIAMSNLD